MQECASLAASKNQGLAWVTPIGIRVEQKYCKRAAKQVVTLMGKMTIEAPAPTEQVTKAKQRNAIAPNIIHSFDAAHMMMTVLSMSEGTSFAMVHDSFGTHACDVDELLEVTKETFVTIYREDWFEALWHDFTFFSNNVVLPEPPEMGTLDIEEVKQSQYFFA